ncbi:MAG: AraC family transcriptional regulator [Actinomycetota bacterium]
MATSIAPLRDPVASPTLASPLGQALRKVRLTGVFYCPSTLTEPWGLSLPPMPDCVWFHIVTAGSCTFEASDGTRSMLRAGDLVLVPHGAGHRAWGLAEAPTPSVLDLPHDELTETFGLLRHGGPTANPNGTGRATGGGTGVDAAPEVTEVICGGVRLDHPAARRLAAALPPLIHIVGDHMPRSDWLRATLDLIGDETRHVRPGGDAVVSRLCDIIVMQALRTWIESDPAARGGWLGALDDPQIGTAMARIHARPEHPWTVGELADEVAMSRSAFAARFTDLVGEPAMRYVTAYRMEVARSLLEAGGTTVAAVGRAVGYDSEAAFSRAFTRVVGRSPSRYRSALLGRSSTDAAATDASSTEIDTTDAPFADA